MLLLMLILLLMKILMLLLILMTGAKGTMCHSERQGRGWG